MREADIVVAVLEEQGIDRCPKVVGLMLSPDGVAVLFFFSFFFFPYIWPYSANCSILSLFLLFAIKFPVTKEKIWIL